jgi:hypothetical protein
MTADAGDTSATLSWTDPFDGGSVITSYTVEYGTVSGGIYDQICSSTSCTDTTAGATITGLTNGTSYHFRVYAHNAAGPSLVSDTTPTATPFGVPSAISGMTADAGDTSTTLSWADPFDGGSVITSYTVEYGTVSGGIYDQTCSSTSCTDTTAGATITGLTNGTAYHFRVYAHNAAGPSLVSDTTPTSTPFGVPSAISGMAADAGNTSVALSWTDPFNGGSAITGYTVEYGTVTSGLYNQTCSSSSCTDATAGATITGLTNGVAYHFRVYANNSVGGSLISNTPSASPIGVPDAIATITATPGDSLTTLAWTAPFNGGSAITGYTVEYGTVTSGLYNQTCSSSSCTDATAGAIITGLTNGIAYHVRIYANNSAGASLVSSTTTTPVGSGGSGDSSNGNSSGNLSIGCDETGSLALQIPNAIDFATKTTNFSAESSASAQHDIIGGGEPAQIRISDTRGYDSSAGNCGSGFTFQVQSTGLHKYNVDGSDFNLRIGLGTVDNSILAEDTSITVSSPDVLANQADGGVVHTATGSSDELITSSYNLVTSDEAFSGDIAFWLDNNLLLVRSDKIQRRAAISNPEATPFATDNSQNYSGPIPTGTYTGTITFTLI